MEGQLCPSTLSIEPTPLDAHSGRFAFQIPPHGRQQHFDITNSPPRIAPLIELVRTTQKDAQTKGDNHATVKSLVDLFVVSVLLDAGAGPIWKYKEKDTELVYARSEGLAIASLDMFKGGLFSSSSEMPYRVDGEFA